MLNFINIFLLKLYNNITSIFTIIYAMNLRREEKNYIKSFVVAFKITVQRLNLSVI